MKYEPGSFLDTLSDEEEQALFAGGHRRRYPRGDALFTEGEASEHVVVVLSGRVKVCFADRLGREAVLGVQGPGDLLGELSAIDGQPRSAAVFALEQVEALVVDAQQFHEMLSVRPRLALAILKLVAARLRDSDRKRVEFGAHNTEGRVARRLVELARRYGEPRGDTVHITVRLTQDELAGWTGSSRESVAKALAAFRARGWIETSRRTIVVLDLEPLICRSV